MAIVKVVRGFKDILPGETGKWRYVEEQAREIFARFGVQEIRTPLVERTELFRRGIGAATDIVEKEMYTFLDRGEESLTLRPEATASVIRAYVEHSLFAADPVAKLYTIGPMFRRERPQKGRFRQFHQINVEFLGQDDPHADGEIILLLTHFLRNVGLAELSLEINSLGCPLCRPAYREAILKFLGGKGGLCEDCTRRVQANPLRVLDCKVEGCRELLADAPRLEDFVCSACRAHMDKVKDVLDDFGLEYRLNPRMVRGLDYYTRTAFEVTTQFLGAQNAVAGGGRYDGLVAELGGPNITGIGFAIGMERLIALLPQDEASFRPLPRLYLAALGAEAREAAFILCNRLRIRGLTVEMDFAGKSLKSQMKRADKMGSRHVLILGEREIAEGRAELRDMQQGRQETVLLAAAEETLFNTLSRGE